LKYLKYKLVDNDTGEFLGDGVMGRTGLRHPFINGLNAFFDGVDGFIYAECPDSSTIPSVGAISVVTLAAVDDARAALLAHRKAHLKSIILSRTDREREAAGAEQHSAITEYSDMLIAALDASTSDHPRDAIRAIREADTKGWFRDIFIDLHT